jgi:uncharacterized membrane-anchored protein
MQDYGQPGGAAPPPPPPPKKKGGKILMILGIILLIVGLILMVMLWPMVGTISSKDLTEKVLKGESGTFTVKDEISDDEWKAMEAMEKLGGEIPKGIDGPGEYVATFELDKGVLKNTPEYQKVPTIGGILGLVLLIVGIILMIVGIIKMMKAKKAPM